MPDRILYTKPSITELEVSYAKDAAQNGWGEKCYEYIDRFEKLFRRYVGSNFAIATSSCTGALHMGLAALGIGPDDEVILSDINWIATASPVVHLGAKPIFVDILEETWCLSPKAVEEAITKKTKAIIATHLYGNLCEMDKLLDIGKKYGIPIIEDSAEAIGSSWHGRKAGSMGLFSTFSFHGTKTITTGEGGIFLTNDERLYERVLTLSNHGRCRKQIKQFWPDIIGFKYKMSNLQAAIGVGQMERINELVERKRSILAHYKERLADLPLQMNPEPDDVVNGSWMPTIIFSSSSGITRDAAKYAFEKENIDARVFFHPLSSLPMFEPRKGNVIARTQSERGINLPSYHEITDIELDRVCEVIESLHVRKS